jgi:hypothetical protein
MASQSGYDEPCFERLLLLLNPLTTDPDAAYLGSASPFISTG